MKLKDGYLQGKRFNLAYRGFNPRAYTRYFSTKPSQIGSTKLYLLGPIALFVKARS